MFRDIILYTFVLKIVWKKVACLVGPPVRVRIELATSGYLAHCSTTELPDSVVPGAVDGAGY